MIRFLDGPAGGQSLMLQRAPLLLRVVINPRDPDGTWDALDSPDDTPRRGEVIHVYRRVTETTSVHIKMSGAGSGFYLMASYSHWSAGHPATEHLARNRVWRAWALLHSYTPIPPPNYQTRPCSSFCHPKEPCTITEAGVCDAKPKP